MRILAYQGKSIISKLIKLQTRSPYSHVAVQLDDETVIETWGLVGVRHVASPKEAHNPNTMIHAFEVIPEYDQELVLKFLKSQLGKKYDYRAIVRFLTRRDSPLDNRWFCSELVLTAFRKAGVDLLARIPASHTSPRDIVMSPLLKGPTETL
jgi:uncharacterized protein YycO